MPSVFQNYFTEDNLVHDHSSRNNNILRAFQMRTLLGQCCLKYKRSVLWNCLLHALQSVMLLTTF